MPSAIKSLVRTSAVVLLFIGNSHFAAPEQVRKDIIASDKEWKSIFDGKTLNGWKASDARFFSVEDGAITGIVKRQQDGPVQRVQWQVGISTGGDTQLVPHIVWQGGKVTDFRLRFKCRLTGGVAHAGIHIRSQVNGLSLTGGYQADIPEMWGFFEGLLGKRPFEKFAGCGERNLVSENGEKTVTFFGKKEELLKDADFRQWTDYKILASGPRIVIEINGRKVVELIDQRVAGPFRTGVLAISLHPLSEMKVQLKEIELKVLTPSLADVQETSRIAETLALIEEIHQELDAGSAQKALTLLKQNPALINSMKGSTTEATYPGTTGATPLLIASTRGHVEVVKWLIANGAAINQVCYNGFLPIHLAANAEIARLLIGAGADLQALTNFQMTPLQYAAEKERDDVVEAIIESGYDIDLTTAILLGRDDLVSRLIQTDPSVIRNPPMTEEERTQQRIETPLMVAVRRGEKKVAEVLLNAGADVNEKYRLMFMSGPPHCGTVTALSIAVVLHNIELIELLLRHGADPKVDCDGSSLLEYARRYRTPEIVALLEKEWPSKPQVKQD